jgi:hypothetical protein
VRGFGKALDSVGKVFAVVNFAAKLNSLNNDPSFKNSVSAMGALAELLGTSEKATTFVNKLARYGREVGEDGAPKAVELVAEAGEEAAETAGRTFLRFLGEAVVKKLSVLAVISGVADAVTGTMEMYDEWKKDNTAGAGAKFGVALGGALIAAAGTIEVISVVFDLSIGGSLLGIVLGILGLVLGMAGAIASLFTAESELEVWADHCAYGKHPGGGHYAGWKGDFAKQLEGLNDALYQVRVKGEIKKDVSHLEIEPTFLTRSSKVKCFVNASSSLSMMTARQELPIRDDQSDCEIEFGSGQQADYVKRIKLRVDMPHAFPPVMWEKLTVVFAIDSDGAGAAIHRTAEVKQGVLEWIWAKL